jgi:CubicO group peptidase (beta-lactamase class C family)
MSIERLQTAAIDRLIDDACRRWTLPGLTSAIVVPGRPPQFVLRGSADIAANAPVTQDTIFRVASISKTFTAVAVMQLVERGSLALDDLVNDHLTSYKLSRGDVTVRHLLTHTAGIGELTRGSDVFRPRAWGMVKAGKPMPTLRKMYGPVQHVEVAPGTKWAYANHGFATLGQLVEDVSGRAFGDYMTEHVFQPLAMHDASFVRTPPVDERLAVGYGFKRGNAVPVTFRELTTTGAGALYCSAGDMAKYVAALAAGGPPVLKAQTLAEMLRPQYPPGDLYPAMGLAFWLDSIGGYLVAGHGGDLPGFKSIMRFARGGPGVFLSTNCNRSLKLEFALAIESLADDILRGLLNVADEDTVLARVGRTQANPFIGRYRPDPGLLTNARVWAMFGGGIEIERRGDRLVIRSPWGIFRTPVDLERESGSSFRVHAGGFHAVLTFDADESNLASSVEMRSNAGFADFRRRERTPRLRATAAVGAAGIALGVVRRRRRRRARPDGR